MSPWVLMVLCTAAGGALVLWNAVSKSKHSSDQMLDSYVEMLAKARAQKIEEVAAAARREEAQRQKDAPPPG